MKYLDQEGLTKVFQLIKTNYATKSEIPTDLSELTNTPGYITGVEWDDIVGKPESFAAETHTHTTANINALTGYTIASTAASIAATDTLNVALGKLQKSIDGKQPAGNYLTTSATAADSAKLGGTAAANYALLASPAFTGTPTAPTATAGTNTTQIATTAFVSTAVDNAVGGLINNAPAALDTLSELSAALGNDPDFATTIATQIGGKISVNSPNYIKSASVSNHVLTLTKGDDTTVTFNDTTYTIASGSANGTISVNGSDVSVTGLGTAAYTNSTTYASASHTHKSNEVTLMTGYSKPNSTAAIATTDTLNAAIGKLEKALDGKQSSGNYASSSHTHVGTEITLTGYSKPNSSSAVAATDNVNQAIGKLEAALDGVQASMEALTAAEVQTIWNTANS